MRKIFLFILSAIVLASCNQAEKKKALEFNNELAGYTQELSKKGTEVGMAIGSAKVTKNFTEVKKLAGELLDYVNDRNDKLASMDNVGGSEQLKSAMQSFLKFEKELVEEAIMPFAQMDVNTTDEQMENALQNLRTKAAEETSHLDNVRKEQAAFAKKNGFRIEAPKSN